MTTKNYWVEKADSSASLAKRNSAVAAVKILLSACDGDSDVARQYFEKWRESEEAQDPELKHYVDCFEQSLKQAEKPKPDLSYFSEDWWKP